MKKPLTTAQATSIIASNTDLANAVGCALFEADIRSEHFDLCCQCAAQLYAQSWLQTQALVCVRPVGRVPEDELIDQKAGEAFTQCEEAGLIPSGWLAIFFAAAVRQAAWMFIQWLVRAWIVGDESTRPLRRAET